MSDRFVSQPSWQPAASAVDQDADEWLFPINGAYEGVLWTGLQVSERLEAKLLASAVDGKAALSIPGMQKRIDALSSDLGKAEESLEKAKAQKQEGIGTVFNLETDLAKMRERGERMEVLARQKGELTGELEFYKKRQEQLQTDT